MKVSISKESKKWLTVYEMEQARKIIQDMKEDDTTAADYIKYAISAAYDDKAFDIDVYKAKATIAGNCRIWNEYGDESGRLDIWIDATAEVNGDGFIKIGAYFSDICKITPDDGRTKYMYIRMYKPV